MNPRIVAGLAFLCALPLHAQTQNASEDLTWAVGAGGLRQPAWVGSSRKQSEPLPYLAFNWRDIVDFTVTDGLYVDLLRKSNWHGGLIGTWRQGRSSSDLGRRLARAGVSKLSGALQAGLYLEHEPVKALTLGADLRRDLRSTSGVYGTFYAEWDIPVMKPIEHSIRIEREFMNRSAMQRYFGLSEVPAASLGVKSYRPRAGASGTTLRYEAFIPTSQSTGFALGLSWTRLASRPARSPLIHDFGRQMQSAFFLAFVLHH